ncbi:MAG: hypothetical protein LUG64_01355 [Clostridiales bacterium]|nr:hypothetical protein [Clostridiales bacterium]
MISVIITILAFWVWPARDLRKVRAVKGIGFSEDAKLDQATVDGWKAGRIRAKKLWVGFGTLIVAGAMLNWLVDILWLEDGAAPDAVLAAVFTYLELGLFLVGVLGWLGGLIYSGRNNKKYLGQLRVTM